MRIIRTVALVVALALIGSSCGGSPDPGQPTGGSDDTAITSIAETTESTEGGDSTESVTETTSATAAAEPFPSLVDAVDSTAGAPRTSSALGSPDRRAAAAIAEALFAEIDSAGVEIWVFPVVGSDEVLLVMDIDGDVIDEDAETSDFDLMAFLSSSPSVTEAGITRFVANLRAVDDAGEVVLTTTLPISAIVEAAANGTDIADDATVFQVLRNGVSQ